MGHRIFLVFFILPGRQKLYKSFVAEKLKLLSDFCFDIVIFRMPDFEKGNKVVYVLNEAFI